MAGFHAKLYETRLYYELWRTYIYGDAGMIYNTNEISEYGRNVKRSEIDVF